MCGKVISKAITLIKIIKDTFINDILRLGKVLKKL